MQVFDPGRHPLAGVGLEFPAGIQAFEIPHLGATGETPTRGFAPDVLGGAAGNEIAVCYAVIVDPEFDLIVAGARFVAHGEGKCMMVIVRLGVVTAGGVGFVDFRLGRGLELNPLTEFDPIDGDTKRGRFNYDRALECNAVVELPSVGDREVRLNTSIRTVHRRCGEEHAAGKAAGEGNDESNHEVGAS